MNQCEKPPPPYESTVRLNQLPKSLPPLQIAIPQQQPTCSQISDQNMQLSSPSPQQAQLQYVYDSNFHDSSSDSSCLDRTIVCCSKKQIDGRGFFSHGLNDINASTICNEKCRLTISMIILVNLFMIFLCFY